MHFDTKDVKQSRRAITTIIPAAHIAASNAAPMPHCHVVPGPAMKNARLYDISQARMNVKPNTFGGLNFAICSSLTPAACCQLFANSSGEYQMPPMTKLRTAQTKTAM